MAKINASDLASLYELGYAANPATPNTIYRMYFNSTAGTILIVDNAFNILYSASGIAGGVNKVNVADLCAINDFGLNAQASSGNTIWRMYYYNGRSFGETTVGIILANQAFTIVWYFEMIAAVAPLSAIDATDICIQQDFGLNAQASAPNAIWHSYLHVGAGGELDPTLLNLVNSDFEIVGSLTMV